MTPLASPADGFVQFPWSPQATWSDDCFVKYSQSIIEIDKENPEFIEIIGLTDSWSYLRYEAYQPRRPTLIHIVILWRQYEWKPLIIAYHRYHFNIRSQNWIIKLTDSEDYLIKLSDSEDYLRSGKPNFHCFWPMFVCMYVRNYGRYFWANYKADGAVHRLKLKVMVPSRSLWFRKSHTGERRRTAPPFISLEPLRYAWNLRIELNMLIRIKRTN